MQPSNPIAVGFTAQIYAWSEGLVLKLFRPGISRATVEYEARLTRIAAATGFPAPGVGEIHEIDGRYGLELEQLEGITMLQAIMKAPWRFITYARQLAELQLEMHQYHVPDMPLQRDRLETKIRRAELLPDDLRQAVLQKLADLPEDDRLCHGDFHPGNILLTSRGPVVIDWIDATRGSPVLDIARSTLLMGGGPLPPGTPMPGQVKIVRFASYHLYLSRYLQLSGLERSLVDEWLPVAAAARLDEGIKHDEARLLSIARSLSG